MTAPAKGDEVRTIMKNTMANLEFIERCQRAGEPVFEVTQLINSFLGALACPWEKHRAKLKTCKLSNPTYADWQKIEDELQIKPAPKSVEDQVSRLRNAFAHGNFEFEAGTNGEISALGLWNTPSGKTNRTWKTTLKIGELRAALKRFADLAAQLD